LFNHKIYVCNKTTHVMFLRDKDCSLERRCNTTGACRVSYSNNPIQASGFMYFPPPPPKVEFFNSMKVPNEMLPVS
jgi:hypothetical protein